MSKSPITNNQKLLDGSKSLTIQRTMPAFKSHRQGERGFVLVIMLLAMLMIAAMALAMNRGTGMQSKMAANRARSIQIHFGQVAAMEDARWQLTWNSTWRTDTTGENYEYDGIIYSRKVLDCAITGYEDTVTVLVAAPGGQDPMRAHFRWQLVAKSTNLSVLYIADYENHRVRKVDEATGIITTVAGTGTPGYNGDNQPAVLAQLHHPTSVFVDDGGHLYIADYDNNRIRKVDAETRIITTVAGNGADPELRDGELATEVSFGKPASVFVDESGNLYFSDYFYHRVRKVDADTNIITTVAGSTTVYGWNTGDYSGDHGPATSAELYRPTGIDMDADGNLYVADYYNNRIRKVDADTKIITTVAGNGIAGFSGDCGPATDAKINWPEGVFVDKSGDIFITDTWFKPRIRKVDSVTGIITTVAGNGKVGNKGDNKEATKAELNFPMSVFVNDYDDIYIADKYNHRIRKVAGDTGIITTVAGNGHDGYNGDNKEATRAELNGPNSAIAVRHERSLPPRWGWAIVEELY